MAMTVAELLAEPQLRLTLLAGGKGTDARITWAHTSDLPRLWEWVTGGELMMTNGLSIPADAAGQVELAESLVAAGASALAIGEGMHAPDLTAEFLAACDSLPLPLLSIPYPLPFIAIARSVAESSLLEESRRLRQTARIYELLRTAGDSGDEWDRLLQGLSTELNSTLHVLDGGCLHPWHPGDTALDGGLAAQLSVLAAAAPKPGTTFTWHRVQERHVLTMAIPTHANALLVVLPHAEPHPDAVVLLHAATVLGLEMSRMVLELAGRRRRGAELLLQAMDGRIGPGELEGRLGSLGVPADRFAMVTLANPDPAELAGVHVRLWRHGYGAACTARGQRLQLAVAADIDEELLLHVAGSGTRIGISAPATAGTLQRAVQESLWALGTATSRGAGLVRYAEGPSWLGLTGYEQGLALVQQLLGPVFEYEQGEDGDLIRTLRTYLDMQRSWQKTAAAMFAHRQTIIYRIRKVGELTGLDMTETSAVAQLWFALQIHDAMSGHAATPA